MKISASLMIATALFAMALSGCDMALRQDMADQPKNRPLSPSEFFADGRSGRPLIENTVAHGAIDNDIYNVPKEYAGYPLRVDEKLLQRGEDRYKVFCTPCHGLQGDGMGMAAVRGMKRPPSYHIDRLRQAPNGYFYDVISNGFGAMYSYSERIAPRDRWAIIAYVRALQLSRNAKVGELPESLRKQLESGGAATGKQGMSAQDYKAPESVGQLEKRALVVGVLGLIVSIVGWITKPEDFYRSYLLAFLLVLGLSLGSLGLLMLQHLTGGHRGILIRRPLESATRVLWLVAAFSLPLIFGMKYLYATHTVGDETRIGWLNPPPVGHEGALSDLQQWYLTHNFFLLRILIYFAIWIGLMWLFNRLSLQQDVNQDDRALRARIKFYAGPGIILYIFAMTFAAIDWAMSLSPHWASTIYGFLFVAGQAISAMSLMIITVIMISKAEPFTHVIQKRHLHDLGKLLFAFNMLWAYFEFSQLLIIWSGNQPEEITFYRSRLFGAWGVVAALVLVLHFFIPFFALLSRDVKRNQAVLPKIAMWLIAMRCVDLFWMTRPEFTSSALPTLWDFAAILALGGMWMWFFAFQLKQRPLLPLGEPKLAEAIANHEH